MAKYWIKDNKHLTDFYEIRGIDPSTRSLKNRIPDSHQLVKTDMGVVLVPSNKHCIEKHGILDYNIGNDEFNYFSPIGMKKRKIRKATLLERFWYWYRRIPKYSRWAKMKYIISCLHELRK